MKSTIVVIVLCAVFLPSMVSAQSFTGKLVKVLDGDTVEVLNNGKAERIRLAQIDCPEKGQPYGQAAKQFVLDLAAHKNVTVQVETVDRYDRIVGEVFLPNGGCLNKMIVEAGYAWQYKRYSNDKAYAGLEQNARSAKRGLWQDKEPVPPWSWRKGIRHVVQSSNAGEVLKCGNKRFCKEMNSCSEARFYLKECNLYRLDRDGDGVPCEALCM